ncbi:hypothetical protein [Bacillus andreraoultii]|uniref:hypothetical protein n=1 Tax=Bacillus andreraoultii TaxID=1499685 RepID=UPI00053AD83C|nr:hypothetical protein [Bacillus andreraoultii]
MLSLIITAVAGKELVERMEKGDIFNRIENAQSLSEKVAIVQETEKYAFEVAEVIFKPNDEIGEEGVQVKDEFVKATIEHNYHYFGLPTPFEQGVTMEEIKFRNGIYPQYDSFFVH